MFSDLSVLLFFEFFRVLLALWKIKWLIIFCENSKVNKIYRFCHFYICIKLCFSKVYMKKFDCKLPCEVVNSYLPIILKFDVKLLSISWDVLFRFNLFFLLICSLLSLKQLAYWPRILIEFLRKGIDFNRNLLHHSACYLILMTSFNLVICENALGMSMRREWTNKPKLTILD